MTATNSITGDEIKTRVVTTDYLKGWERIFGQHSVYTCYTCGGVGNYKNTCADINVLAKDYMTVREWNA